MIESLTLRVWRLHCAGMAPSEIDHKLRLEDGTAHDEVVSVWYHDKLTSGQYIVQLSAGKV